MPAELLTSDEIRSRWPYIYTGDLRGGTFCGQDGYADPYLTAMSFAAGARKRGVTILENTPVTSILLEGNRVRGVRADKKTYTAPVVVNCAGPWAEEVGRMAGLELPVLPIRRQVFMTKALTGIPKPIPMVIDMDSRFYFRGENPGMLMGMSDPQQLPGFDTSVDRAFLERVVERAVHRAPVLVDAEIGRGWGGLYAVTPDENPIIGEVPDARGLFCAVGFSGHGFQHGPAVGQILSELIIQKNTDFDLSPFRFGRFDGVITSPGEGRVV